MILLSLMADGETYGYEIITRLNRHGGVMGMAREGTIYPILYRLEENGLVRCRVAPAPANGGSRKYYSLTPLGENTLQELDNPAPQEDTLYCNAPPCPTPSSYC